MDRWKNQLNALGTNAFDFAQRISSELTAETETDPSTELQYHKDQAIKFERDLIKCQSELSEKNREVAALSDSVREASEEVELTRQTLLNRLAAKELELEKAQHQIEQLRDFDFQNESTTETGDSDQLALELDIVRAEKANLCEELTALNNKLQYYQSQLAAKSVERTPEPVNQMKPQELELLQDELTKSNNRVESLRQEMSNLLEKNHSLLNECTERQEICQKLEHQLTTIQSINASTHSTEIEKLRGKLEIEIKSKQELAQRLNQSEETNKQSIEQLNNKIEALLHENNQLRGENVGELESLNEKVNTLMSELATAQELAQKSNEFDKTHKQSIDQLNEKIDASQRENERLKNESTSEINELRSKLHSLELDQESKRELAQKSVESDETITQLQKEIEKWRLENEHLRTGHSSELGKFREIIHNMESELNLKQEQIDNIDNVDESNKQTIEQLNNKIKALQRENDRLNDENVDESEANELHARINELESELETARLQVQQSKEIGEINKSHKEMIDQLNEQIEALDAENNQIKHESRSQMDSTRSRINKLGAEFEAALAQIQQYSELEKAYKQSIDQLNEQIEALITENSQLKSVSTIEANDMRARINGLENELLAACKQTQNSEEVDKAYKQIEQLNEQLEILQHENNQLRNESTNEVKELHAKINELETGFVSAQELSEKSEELDKATKKIDQLNEYIEKMGNTNNLLNDKEASEVDELHDQIDELKLELNSKHELAYKLDHVETMNKELLSQLEDGSKLFEVEKNKLKNEFSSEINTLHAKIQELESTLETARTQTQTNDQSEESNNQIEQLAGQIEALHSENSQLKNESTLEMDNLRVRLNELTVELESMHIQVQKSDETAKIAKQSFDELNRSNVQLTEQVKTLRDENDQLKSALIESETSLDEMMTERKNAELYRLHTQDRTERKELALEEAQAKIQHKDNEVDFYRASLEKEKQVNEDLQKRIHGINSTIRDLQSTYADSQTQLRTAEKTLAQSDCELKQTIQQLQSEKNAIEQQNAETSERLRTAESQVLDLRAEIELLEERCHNDSISHHVNASNPSTSANLAMFEIPPELRQFILSAITCDEQQRADGALLLASLIGCTPEERLKVEESYKLKGWTSMFRSPQPSASAHKPQNTRELLRNFVDFLERESAMGSAANIETSEFRLDNEIPQTPNHQTTNRPDKDLTNIIGQ